MKFLPLVWAGLWRKPLRTTLTLLSVVVALLLLGVMHGVTAAIDGVVDQMSETRLRVQSRVNITQQLPLAHLARIESVPGVQAVGYYSWFGAYFQEPGNTIDSGAMDMSRLRRIYPDLVVADEAFAAMERTRNGALVGKDLAASRGWSVGDRIPLRSSIWETRDGTGQWTFEIVGVYSFENERAPSNELWMNYAYFDERRSVGNGTVSLYFVSIDNAEQAATIGDEIDQQFVNSSFETQTQNEKDWVRARINQVGDIGTFLSWMMGAVLFTLLFLTGNTMMQSVRERTPELAVLKTYGFVDAAVAGLVIAESLALCGAGAFVGLWLARLVSPVIYRAMGAGGVSFPWEVVLAGFGLAGLVAVVSALPPVWRIRRLKLVDSLAGR